ncbi:MAG: restriction endonuclease [Chloroflexales bacterium]|nr:restriction endonuclease [Chloroflexales bacterium]
MPAALPVNPDIRRQLKARLLDLSPRAFELFAGDLLVYIGLQNIVVTRYSGDNGVDAHGDLVAKSGFALVPTGVQVKRHRSNVQRTDIDRFIGALGGQFHHGIFITTAGYAAQARTKATSSPLIRVDTVDGDQVVSLMMQHSLGVQLSDAAQQLDEHYFLDFETQAVQGVSRINQTPAVYQTSPISEAIVVQPEDDLITVRALSYALRVDTTTVRDWVERGKLAPDKRFSQGGRESFFFRRDRLDGIRRALVRADMPITAAEWRQAFLDFARSKGLTKSYKPVLIKALLKLADRNGQASIDALAHEFHSFYLRRQHDGKPIEFNSPLANPGALSLQDVKRLIVKYPLDRFLIKNFLEYLPLEGIVRFAPQLWRELRFYELLDVLASADEQLRHYYRRHGSDT